MSSPPAGPARPRVLHETRTKGAVKITIFCRASEREGGETAHSRWMNGLEDRAAQLFVHAVCQAACRVLNRGPHNLTACFHTESSHYTFYWNLTDQQSL